MDSQTPLMSALRSSAPSTPVLDAAMSAVQGEMQAAPKDANNPHFNRSYADLTAIISVAQHVLAKHGIARYQPVWSDDRPGVVITTRIACKGEWIEADLRMPVDKNNAQAVGSAITYGKRYGLAAMLGIATADDDGEEAAKAPPPKPSRPKRAEAERERETVPSKPSDSLGPRCTGKAAGISKAIGDRMRPLVALRKGKATEVWADVLAEAGVDVSKYGATMPRSEALTIADGQMVAEYLARLLDEQPADMEALRNECSKLWVQICKGDPGFKLDDWKAEWAGFAQIDEWPDRPTAAHLGHAIAGMTRTLEKIHS
jgi:hypothetical protein